VTDKPTDFDFDFQVDQSRAEPGDDSSSNGNAGANGAATPSDPKDLDAPARAGNGSAQSSSSPRRRRPRRAADPGGGGGDGRNPSNGTGQTKGNRRAGRLVREDENGHPDSGDGDDGRSVIPFERPGRRRFEPSSTQPEAPVEEDWLGTAGDDGGGDGLQSFPDTETDTGGAPPRTPREGRNLARDSRKRAAQRRAEGRDRVGPGDVPFESLLERQPQKSRTMRRATPLLDAVRDAVGGGVERLKDGAQIVRERAGGLRELRPRPAGPRRSNGDGAEVATDAGSGGAKGPPRIGRLASRRPQRPKPGRIKKLRFVIVFAGLALLAVVSTFFGMMMAIARDIPSFDTEKQYETAKNSIVLDNHGEKMGTLLNNNQRILIPSEEMSPYIKEAVVAIEDERFYEHRGVDFQGLFRAGIEDLIPGGPTQGASTISQQFVKNALEAQNSRTIFQKFRESAYAYHLERQWDKDTILTQYLNTIYFGEGAYGVEAAARTYFGYNHPGCGTDETNTCASQLLPEEAALLAGIISSPSAYSPKYFPEESKARRDLVLQKMKEQGVLSDIEYEEAAAEGLPAPSTIEKPKEDSLAPYFTSWLRQLVVDRYGANQAFGGGLTIKTTLDLDMQEAVEGIAYNHLAGIEPTASVVVLDNSSGEIRAMVGGNDYESAQFNIATQGLRQPGSTFKPFILATALEKGRSPSEVFESRVKEFPVPGGGKNEVFEVHNYEDNYLGSADLATATVYSDNSVFAELGIQVGTGRIAKTAEEMGIESNVSDNPAMTLGALTNCCTPLEMTHAFQTLATGGYRVSGELDTIPGNERGDPYDDGPVPINKVLNDSGKTIDENKDVIKEQVLDEGVAEETTGILQGVIDGGTGVNASLGGDEWGKTGTTENYGDAWFCGATENFTTCVWVGYPNKVTPMETEYGGQPVAGGTYPAEIWASVMSTVEDIYASYGSDYDGGESDTYVAPSGSSGYVAPSTGGGGGGGGSSGSAPAPAAPAPSGGGGGGAPSGGGGVGL
jgi:penicillin-binding protein 1A